MILIANFEMANFSKISLLIIILCILISFKNQRPETKEVSSSLSASKLNWPSSSRDSFFLAPFTCFRSINERFQDAEECEGEGEYSSALSLEYDFYRDSCPQAEKIIGRMISEIYKLRSSVASSLLRLVFHDCFIQGCDASILLDAENGIDSEKDSFPNKGLKGFDIIDIIKSEIEKECPGIVSCSDILALAARESVVKAGGPFYPLLTGRRDSTNSFGAEATSDLPSPQSDLVETLATFASRGFDERETVSLLGAHSIGSVHCNFFQNRLYNFERTGEPDPSLDTEFLNEMRSRCNKTTMEAVAAAPSQASPSSSISPPSPSPETQGGEASASSPKTPPTSLDNLLLSSPEEPAMEMAYEGPGVGFGTLYYRSLLEGKGILFADQQLMAAEETGIWVRAYASDASLFRRDFSLSMMKLSNFGVLTGSMGQVRLNCSRVA